MRFFHGPVEYDIDDVWLNDAGMVGFQPTTPSYRPAVSSGLDRSVQLVAVSDVEPLRRQLSHGVFNDSVEFGTARERVVKILQGFRSSAEIPPVEMDRLEEPCEHHYRLRNGAHRFYCSLAAGFSHVPSIVYEPAEWSRS